jgi:hypothetical protein
MAFALAVRVAIQLEVAAIPAEVAAYRWVAQGGSTSTTGLENALRTWWSELIDPTSDPGELSAAMSAGGPESESGVWLVTDFTGTFELRKLQWRWSRAPTGGLVEDQDTITWHFIKATGGTPGTYNDTTDLAAVETAATALWAGQAAGFQSFMHNDQYRWYKDGPAFWHLSSDGTKYLPVVPNPAIRVTEVDVAGSLGASAIFPPQIAITVTKKTSSRKNWGRIYYPIHGTSVADAQGRVATGNCDSICAAWVTFCNACRTASMIPVVFSIPKVARDTAGGGELAAQGAIAFEISSLQVDNLFDVMRTRRYSGPTYRKVTALT